ncbi:MAG: hypothetical protein IJW48_00990 [Clostridia bacterium]|nr:hypothetical protein [Clostridia bacterium]
MIEQDTIRLLRECDAGIKMGVSGIDDVINYVKSHGFKRKLSDCRSEHMKLSHEIESELHRYEDRGKSPNPLVRGMSKMKTEMKMAMTGGDKTVADLMTDGCNMGVKSLNKYLNKYEAASEVSKDITKRLINLEEKLAVDIRGYL